MPKYFPKLMKLHASPVAKPAWEPTAEQAKQLADVELNEGIKKKLPAHMLTSGAKHVSKENPYHNETIKHLSAPKPKKVKAEKEDPNQGDLFKKGNDFFSDLTPPERPTEDSQPAQPQDINHHPIASWLLGGTLGNYGTRLGGKPLMSHLEKVQERLPTLTDDTLQEIRNHYNLDEEKVPFKPTDYEIPMKAGYMPPQKNKLLSRAVQQTGMVDEPFKGGVVAGPIFNKPGAIAHEFGHADMEFNNPVLKHVQRYGRPIGQLASIPASYYASKNEDNPLLGAAKGGAAGVVANTPTLLTEFEASRRAWKALDHTSLNPELILKNKRGLIPAGLTYLLQAALPGAGIGAVNSAFNMHAKHKMMQEAEARQAHQKVSIDLSKEDLLSSKELKDVKTYILGKNELEKPRLLSQDEKNRIAHRKRTGWTFWDPAVGEVGSKRMDATQIIQNPLYRATLNAFGSSLPAFSLGTTGGTALASLLLKRPTIAKSLIAGGTFGVISAAPSVLNIKNQYKKQKLYNEITEEYIKHHPEGQITTVSNVLKEMLDPAKKVTDMKGEKKKVVKLSSIFSAGKGVGKDIFKQLENITSEIQELRQRQSAVRQAIEKMDSATEHLTNSAEIDKHYDKLKSLDEQSHDLVDKISAKVWDKEKLQWVINKEKEDAALPVLKRLGRRFTNRIRPGHVYPLVYGLTFGPAFAARGIIQNRQANNELNDLKTRFEGRMQKKREAELFVTKAKMPLYKKHLGETDKIKAFDEMFKQSDLEEDGELLSDIPQAVSDAGSLSSRLGGSLMARLGRTPFSMAPVQKLEEYTSNLDKQNPGGRYNKLLNQVGGKNGMPAIVPQIATVADNASNPPQLFAPKDVMTGDIDNAKTSVGLGLAARQAGSRIPSALYNALQPHDQADLRPVFNAFKPLRNVAGAVGDVAERYAPPVAAFGVANSEGNDIGRELKGENVAQSYMDDKVNPTYLPDTGGNTNPANWRNAGVLGTINNALNNTPAALGSLTRGLGTVEGDALNAARDPSTGYDPTAPFYRSSIPSDKPIMWSPPNDPYNPYSNGMTEEPSTTNPPSSNPSLPPPSSFAPYDIPPGMSSAPLGMPPGNTPPPVRNDANAGAAFGSNTSNKGTPKVAADNEPMLAHQKRVVERLSQPDQPGLILFHTVGQGKTRSSIEAYKALGLPTEVIPPASLEHNFKKEIHKWVGKEPKDIDYTTQQNVARNGISPDKVKDKLLIIDEAHRLRNQEGKGFRALKEVTPLAKKRLLLTGTPLYNSPSDIAPLINLAAGKDILPEKPAEFANQYIGQRVVFPTFIHRMLGVKPGTEQFVKNPEYLKRVFHKLIDYQGGTAEGFPSVKEETIKVPMGDKQQQIYKAVQKQLPWHLRLKVRANLPPDKKELDKMISFLSGARAISNTTAGYTKNEEDIQSPKIDAAVAFLKKKLQEDPNYKSVVYSNYLESGVNPYRKQLDQAKIPYGVFTGVENDKARQQTIKDYNANKIKTLLISSAAGEGLDLKGTRLVQVLENHWNNEKLKQVIGRAARYKSHSDLPKEKQNVLVQHYLSTLRPGFIDKLRHKTPTSSDEYLENLANQKEELNNEFLNLMKN